MSELGEALKDARLEKGISLEELQALTKIQKRYLQAIEQGEYGQLPGRFYARAFIKSYAEAVGLNFDQLFEEHAGEVPKPHEAVEEQLPLRSERTREKSRKNTRTPRVSGRKKTPSVLLPSVLAVVVIVGLFAIVWMTLQNSGTSPESGAADNTGQSVEFSKNPAADKQKDSSDQANKGTPSSGQQKSDTGDQQTKSTPPPKTDKPSQIVTKTGGSGNYAEYKLTNTDQFKVKLKIMDRATWFGIKKSGPNGKYIIQGTFQPGKTITRRLGKDKQVYINIANTHHVKMWLNGELFTYPSTTKHQKFLIKFPGTKNVS